ncbi:MAG: DUF3667 domain-containing protein [Marinifilaceae bacterium]
MNLKRLLKVRRKRELAYPEMCPNCYHALHGKYCSNCGQSVRDFHRPFWSVINDVVGDIAAFDNRLVRTIVPLLITPGKLTREFMRGRRASYMPPFKLYLFLTFIAFFLLSYNHKPETMENEEGHLAIKSSDGEVYDVEKYFIDDPEEEETPLDSLQQDSLKLGRDTTLTVDSREKSSQVDEQSKDGNNMDLEFNGNVKGLIDMYKMNPGLVIDNAFKKLSQTLFFILPLFALLLWLLYVRRKLYLLEHLLISVNFHSYIFLVVILSELLIMINWSVTTSLGLYLYFTIPLRLFMEMKFYYKQGWIKTFIKFVILSFWYNIMVLVGLGYSLLTLVV